MSNKTEIVQHQSQASEIQRNSEQTPAGELQIAQNVSPMSIVAQLVLREGVPIETMERLMAMQERMDAQKRREAFFSALARITPKMPRISKRGTSNNGRYMKYEDIDRELRPIISEEGFAVQFDTSEGPNGKVRILMIVNHRDGHEEKRQIDMAPDRSGNKANNDAQAVISATSYGKRALVTLFFNVVAEGEDDDGNGGSKPITQEQADDLRAKLQDAGGNMARFLKYMDVTTVDEITGKQLARAIEYLEALARKAAK